MQIINIALIVVFFVNTILGTLIIFNQKRNPKGSTYFGITAYMGALWVASVFFFLTSDDYSILINTGRLAYATGLSIAFFLFLFSLNFLNSKINKLEQVLNVVSTGLTTSMFIQTIASDAVIKNFVIVNDVRTVTFGPYYLYYLVLTVLLFIGYYVNFFVRISKLPKENRDVRRQFYYLISGTGISVLIGSLCSLILPTFGNFSLFWVGPVCSIIFVVISVYAIFKYRLFNVRLIATQLTTFLIWIFILMRTFAATSTYERVLNGLLLLFLIIFGIILIQSVLREVRQKEELQNLTKELEIANEKLKSLDKLKTEFLSLASHQLRSPLTAIKGYTSMLLEGDFGSVNDNQKQAIDRVFQSSQNLTRVVEDLLDVSKIEQGGMQFQFAPSNIKPLLDSLVGELSVAAKNKGLSLTLIAPENGDFTVTADELKLRQVLLNLIDNAVKYTKQGSITVSLEETGNYVRVSVADTGMGMTEEIKGKLFQKFSRGEGGKVNAGGSGLGLYLAKEIVLAHKGKLWVESDGLDKGSTFIVELRKANAPVI